MGLTTLLNTDTSGFSTDIFIAKFTPAGSLIWATNFGGKGDETGSLSNPFSFAVGWKGDCYISGQYRSPALTIGTTTLTNTSSIKSNSYFAKFDNAGSPVWAQSFDYHVSINSLATDFNDNIFLTGSIDSTSKEGFGKDTLSSTFNGTVIYAKYDPSGNEIWAKISGKHGSIGGHSISVDLCGKLWISAGMGNYGVSPDTVTFDGHQVIAPSGSQAPVFLAEFDTSGNYESGMALPCGAGSGGAFPLSQIKTDGKGNLYISGSYFGTAMLLGSDVLPYGGLGYTELYAGRYKYDTIHCIKPAYIPLTVDKVKDNFEITFYPNPAANECTIQSQLSLITGSKAAIFDLAGKLIRTYPLSGNGAVISLMGIAPGMYQCRVYTDGNCVVTKKLVVLK